MELSTDENVSVKSWLKRVIYTTKKNNNSKAFDIFGAPLYKSLQVASILIAYEENDTVIGNIPVVIAKCGSFLKEEGLYVEGVFRKSGSAKRVGELQNHFNSASDYGKYLNWKLGYTVHDAASCMRRFLNHLPEPVITFILYEPFRNIMSTYEKEKATEDEYIDETSKLRLINEYQKLIDQLPEVNQYLLFYLLDLLVLFSRYSKYTKMNSMALASVFTPGILLSPEHAMNPFHYKLSQRVVRFLIDNQEHFHLPRNNHNKYNNHSRSFTIHPHITPSSKMQYDKQHLLRANTVPVQKKPNFS